MHTRNIGSPSFITEAKTNMILSPSERTGRKSYKLSNKKGGEKKEAVWPPHLEAALLEGGYFYLPHLSDNADAHSRVEKVPAHLKKRAPSSSVHKEKCINRSAHLGYNREMQDCQASGQPPSADY